MESKTKKLRMGWIQNLTENEKKIIDDLKKKYKKGEYFSEEYECIKIDPNVDPLLLLSQCADTPEGLIAFLKQFSVDNAA